MKLLWMDTHIHVSDIGPGGKRRERMLEDLLEVMDRCDAALRFVISGDFPYMFGVDEDKNPFPPKVASFVKFLKDAGGSDEAVSRIGFENAGELFKIKR